MSTMDSTPAQPAQEVSATGKVELTSDNHTFHIKCFECKVTSTKHCSDGELSSWLWDYLTSTGCCPGCGTLRWQVYRNGENMFL